MIELDSVSFRYPRRRTALQHISLMLGDFPLAVLGPNGAGKSTLLSLIAGLARPTTGIVALTEYDRRSTRGSSSARLRKHTGWLPQDVAPIPGFTCLEQVTYAGWLKGMRVKAARRAATEALERLHLETLARRRVQELSGGQRRRLGIAQALAHGPDYLVLDEPHAGLDPEQRSNVRAALDELAETTRVIVSTHQTEDLATTYRGVLVIADGRVLMHGSISDFYGSTGVDRAQPLGAETAYRRLLDQARAHPA